jgi:hypothetical protein
MRTNGLPPTLFDRAAAAATPAESDIQSFLAIQRVFISSVMADLATEREAVALAIETLGAEPVWFERFGGRDSDPEDAYLAEVRTSNIYIGILGKRYGKLLPTRFSATHAEFLEAERSGSRISVWTIRSEDWDGHQQRFVEEVRTFHTTGSFGNAGELAAGVSDRLRRIAAEELSPWCKLGHVIFRASKIHIASSHITVTAHVRDAEVADALEAMQPDRWASNDLQFTDPSRSWTVRIKAVESEATSTSARGITLHLERSDSQHQNFMDMSYSTGNQTYTPDDLTQLALREHLFGEKNPVDSSFSTIPLPLPAMPDSLSEDVIRPILRLLITESLVGSGRASRIKALRLGVPVMDRRPLKLEWVGSTSHASPPRTLEIEGVIRL